MKLYMQGWVPIIFGAAALLLSTVTTAAGISRDLIGSWTSTAPLADGRSMTVVMTLESDGDFDGTASIGPQPVWQYGGLWDVEGQTLVYYYKQSSIALPEEAKVDRDDVVSTKADQIVLRNQRTGATHKFTRVK